MNFIRRFPRVFRSLAPAAAALLVVACGGGRDASPDIVPTAPVIPETVASGPNSFLLFPNPQVQPDGSYQTNSSAFAQAYYAAIDPGNQKDTLSRWKSANGFDNGTGTQVTVVFGDKNELAWGRRVTARQNADGTLAFMVENYQVALGQDYSYSPLSVDAAVVQDQRWHIDTHGVEFSPGPGGGTNFVKFYNFNAVTGVREMTVDMDGRGEKFMPGPCLACHGGRGDALTPPDANGKQLFPLVANSVSQKRGDALAKLHILEVDALDFSSAPQFTRAAQEANFKAINMMVLCSFPLPGTSSLPEDACRRKASSSEWQGTAATFLKAAYGGPGLPQASYSDTYVEKSWTVAGQTALYTNAESKVCRTCHILRGTGSQSDVDFETFAKFDAYAPAIKALVVDRGSMPLSDLLADRYFNTSVGDTVASYLQTKGMVVRDANGALLKPGRPIADPGPERTVRQGATTLSAAGSLYSSTYQWSIVSGPNGATPPVGATLSNPTAPNPSFIASTDGTYVLQLITGNGSLQSSPVQLKIAVNNSLSPDPASIRFADIKAVLTSNASGCVTCHLPGGDTPDIYQNIDRNGDGVIDATDDQWFYAEVRGRINFTSLAGSLLLQKPAGRRHSKLAGFDSTKAAGQPERKNYDLFLNWMLNGAPQ